MIVAAVDATTSTASSTARGGPRVEPVQHGERARGEPERQHVHDRAERVLADQARAAAQAEREAAVRGGVADGGDRERQRVRDAGAERAAEREEDQRVRERARRRRRT